MLNMQSDTKYSPTVYFAELAINLSDNKASVKVRCQWHIGPTYESISTIYLLLETRLENDLHEATSQEENMTGNLSQLLGILTANESTLDDWLSTTVVLISPSNAGYVIRSDLLEQRMIGCELVQRIISFTAPGQYCEPIPMLTESITLSEIFDGSLGAILLDESPSVSWKILPGELEADLSRRLSLQWLADHKITGSKLALVHAKRNLDHERNGIRSRQEHDVDLIMNAGVFQAAKHLGIDLLVLDEPGCWIEDEAYASFRAEFIPVDMALDGGLPSRIGTALIGYSVDGIVTFTDSYLSATAIAAEILSLSTEPSLAFLNSTNKFDMRKSISDEVDFICVQESMSLPTATFGMRYPLIVKPCKGSSSQGVCKVGNALELVAAVEKIAASGQADHGILVETYITGPEVDANFVLCNGDICFFEVSDDFPKEAETLSIRSTNGFLETLCVLPSKLPEAEIVQLRTSLHKVLLELGFRSGVFHLEARIRDSSMSYTWENKVLDLRYPKSSPASKSASSVFLIEINARPPGIQSVYATSFTYGVDYCALHLLFAIQEKESARALSKAFLHGAQFYSTIVFCPANSTGARVPDDPCGQLLRRQPQLSRHILKICHFYSGRTIPDNAIWEGYAIVFSRVSREQAIELGITVRRAFVKYARALST